MQPATAFPEASSELDSQNFHPFKDASRKKNFQENMKESKDQDQQREGKNPLSTELGTYMISTGTLFFQFPQQPVSFLIGRDFVYLYKNCCIDTTYCDVWHKINILQVNECKVVKKSEIKVLNF